jgi:hypothetical protein
VVHWLYLCMVHRDGLTLHVSAQNRHFVSPWPNLSNASIIDLQSEFITNALRRRIARFHEHLNVDN